MSNVDIFVRRDHSTIPEIRNPSANPMTEFLGVRLNPGGGPAAGGILGALIYNAAF
ncbi:hypothetical protein [Streptomyces chartreusis]|uniref:hypothetical protein n=1 Tax=Streptomyces chartreusis TaxID=1969 RepID=UPI0033B7FC3D